MACCPVTQVPRSMLSASIAMPCGSFRNQFITAGDSRRSIGLGKIPRKAAASILVNVENLISSQLNGAGSKSSTAGTRRCRRCPQHLELRVVEKPLDMKKHWKIMIPQRFSYSISTPGRIRTMPKTQGESARIVVGLHEGLQLQRIGQVFVR